MRHSMKAALLNLLTAFFILLFAYTAFSKLRQPGVFKLVLAQSPWIGNWASFLVPAIPLTELMVSALLFFPASRKKGLLLSFVLMSLFTLYVLGMLLFSPELPCSCGGVLSSLGWRMHLALNVACTALAFVGWNWNRVPVSRQVST